MPGTLGGLSAWVIGVIVGLIPFVMYWVTTLLWSVLVRKLNRISARRGGLRVPGAGDSIPTKDGLPMWSPYE